MKKLFTLLALTISFSMNAQISTSGTSNSGQNSNAIGNNSVSSGNYSTAIGNNCTATQHGSFAFGGNASATSENAMAIGFGSNSSAEYAIALGHDTSAYGYNTTAMGYLTTAIGSFSTSSGWQTTASDFGSFVIGYNNLAGSTTNNANTPVSSNTAFVVGNGADENNRSDAFVVMFNGDTTISNDLTVSGDVVILSDARLKSNIVSLGSTLPKLLQIDGKSYEMKGKQKIGVLAQEIKEVFPELVTKGDNEMLAVNYQGLVPVLINALKEQQSEIVRLKEQEKRIERLEKLIANIN
ncbi:MAG: hypothetical protein CMC36_01835 [Flavobacteriaceae bacterium]|nr:hypothetical protein [Flavobacteriaceae bacterium]